jgi:hypothetical protein
MSMDPIGFTGNPFTFNRYAYVNNNPYGGTDPSGMEAITGSRIETAENNSSPVRYAEGGTGTGGGKAERMAAMMTGGGQGENSGAPSMQQSANTVSSAGEMVMAMNWSPVGQNGSGININNLIGNVYKDYPELSEYGINFVSVSGLLDDDGKPAGGAWTGQSEISIATSGFAPPEIQGAILHELLHVDAANHNLSFGNRDLYRLASRLTGQNHDEIYKFQANYTSHLSGTEYLSPAGVLTDSLPSLNSLSWRQ